jgi:hypothetical protein
VWAACLSSDYGAQARSKVIVFPIISLRTCMDDVGKGLTVSSRRRSNHFRKKISLPIFVTMYVFTRVTKK